MSYRNYINKSSLTVIFLLMAMICCHAQQMVQTPKDIVIVCQRDNEFVGKPLKVLLKEIKPSIKMVYAEGGWIEQAPMFTFFFMSRQDFDSCRKEGNIPLRLKVYVRDFFQWTYENRGRELYWTWTKEDEEKYGNLIITAIRISGNCAPNEKERNVNL